MALINCPECNKDVSDTALSCPHCGFRVANYIEELNRKRCALEKEQETKRLLEMKQRERNAKKEKKAVIKQMKSTYLKQNHKKSLWIFVALVPCSVIMVLLPYISSYIERKQLGLIYVKNDTIFSWLNRNVVPMLPHEASAFFIVLLVPAIFYVVANNIKNIKVAKMFLVLGLLYLTALTTICIIFSIRDIIYIIRWLIPLGGYLALYRNATYLKQNAL